VVSLALAAPDLDGLHADALVIGVTKGPDGPRLAPGAEEVDHALGGRLLETLVALGATGAEDEVVRFATLGAFGVPVLAAAGLGTSPKDGAPVTEDAVRRAAGAAVRALGGRGRVASTLSLAAGGDAPGPSFVQAAGEGALLGAYQFTTYRTTNDQAAPPSAVTLIVPDPKDKGLRNAAKRASAIADAVALCRDLVNTPPNELPPARFADRAAAAANKAGLEVEILDEKALKRGGYGGVLGVGGGSSRPPRLLRLRYAGRGGTRVALIGKGITFDSGGISIKPAEGMDKMKSDMAGAAAIIATTVLAATLKLPLEINATVPMAENLPSGTAYRPADVLTMYGGKRVEVLNTDAEGRLVLADAIVRACEDRPAYLLETSTLTGAQRIALGDRFAGVMGSDELRERVVGAGNKVGEGMWPMPLPGELRRALASSVADIANVTSERIGGMLAGGIFLREFVAEGVQWAHIDIAGPAFNAGSPWGYNPKGGTGVPIRTLLAVLEDIAADG
jgi:leucyl aminopeptidase